MDQKQGLGKKKKKSQGIEHATKILKLGKFEEIDEELEGSGGHTEGELLLEGKHLPHPAADSRGGGGGGEGLGFRGDLWVGGG